jgi:hypothetical protein
MPDPVSPHTADACGRSVSGDIIMAGKGTVSILSPAIAPDMDKCLSMKRHELSLHKVLRNQCADRMPLSCDGANSVPG